MGKCEARLRCGESWPGGADRRPYSAEGSLLLGIDPVAGALPFWLMETIASRQDIAVYISVYFVQVQVRIVIIMPPWRSSARFPPTHQPPLHLWRPLGRALAPSIPSQLEASA